MATGMSGRPSMPTIPGAETFQGDYHHSSQHPGAEPYCGKDCVILGSNNSAHDIAADLWENGAKSVTIVQRSSTHVIRSQTFTDLITGPLYSEEAMKAGITTEKADMLFASIPYKVSVLIFFLGGGGVLEGRMGPHRQRGPHSLLFTREPTSLPFGTLFQRCCPPSTARSTRW